MIFKLRRDAWKKREKPLGKSVDQYDIQIEEGPLQDEEEDNHHEFVFSSWNIGDGRKNGSQVDEEDARVLPSSRKGKGKGKPGSEQGNAIVISSLPSNVKMITQAASEFIIEYIHFDNPLPDVRRILELIADAWAHGCRVTGIFHDQPPEAHVSLTPTIPLKSVSSRTRSLSVFTFKNIAPKLTNVLSVLSLSLPHGSMIRDEEASRTHHNYWLAPMRAVVHLVIYKTHAPQATPKAPFGSTWRSSSPAVTSAQTLPSSRAYHFHEQGQSSGTTRRNERSNTPATPASPATTPGITCATTGSDWWHQAIINQRQKRD
ncbi:hypothetical protein DFH27DRAFT_525346 [Peziza echinospora]|nr:hypothetical protein DFH27DRAFT_525346 [Peziza echinospora]